MTAFDSTAASLLGALTAASLKATVVLALGVGIVWILRRRSAALKHAVWTTVLGATVAMLVLPAVVPAWRVIPMPLARAEKPTPSAVRDPRSSLARTASDASEDNAEGSVAFTPAPIRAGAVDRWEVASRRFASHWPAFALIVWLAGVILVLARHLLSVVTLRRLCGRARVLGDSLSAVLGRSLADDLRITRAVTFLSSDELELPLTWGIFRPRVVLPAHANEWNREQLQHVLQHELAHVKRLDASTQVVATAACAAFWFHPLVWRATRHMQHERERACDDRVLTRGVMPSAYASDLLALVDAQGNASRYDAALAMTGGSALERRVLALLDPTIERGTASRWHVAAALVLAGVFVVPVAALRGAEPTPEPTPATTVAPAPLPEPAVGPDHFNVSAVSRVAPPGPRRRLAPQNQVADLFESCRPMGSHLHDGVDPVDGRELWTVSAVGADCRADLTTHGAVTFNRDVTAIDRLADNGDVTISVSLRGETTNLEARAAGAGAITYVFTRGGAPADFDAAGRAWLAQVLTALDRHTAFAVDQRLPLLLESGGASQVLDEIDQLGTEHARTTYLSALAERSVLSDHDLNRALGVVAQLTTDHDRLTSLLALARGRRLEGSSLETYLYAAATLDTASSRRRAIDAVRHQ